MLGNYCEKMVVLSSTTTNTNEWQQNHIDEKGLMASTGMVIEKPSQDQQHQQQQQQQQQPLKCPRCDSSNTKFCYYNNYSLSQPRHFCKACKRYWTRGGTLRNVPVGGGCRKHKRVKRLASAINEAPLSSASTAPQNPSVQPHVDLSSSSSTHINPLFYGLPTNPPELNFPFPRLNSRVTSIDAVSGFDLQPQLSNVLGLGFSSGLMNTDINNDNNYRNGGFNSSKRIQDVVTSNPLLSSYPILGSANSNSTSTLASLIASSLQQQKLVSSGFKDMQGANSFQGLLPFENLHMAGDGEGGTMMKEVKMEGGQNRLDWDIHNQNQIAQNNSPDPSLWNTASVGAWLDPSVPSLI